ncbi:DUF6268 family outer membrane beta-barrel protein [Chitinibacter tainanensis]|uniref:DUF6268 family outer membrane beta-barrel protein n=1 Tax=Chitinibacter tainanensis TaxID=230667 RepID=UPI00235787F5|nr:DUF6268 family outer membrane beta-barrel protein [Chitinibacter tainanensis]
MFKTALRALALTLAATGAAHAADGSTLNYSLTPVLIGDFNLDSGGKASGTWMTADFAYTKALDAQRQVGLSFGAGRQNWSFDHPTAWGGKTPFETLHRFNLALNYNYMSQSGWMYNFAPGVSYAGESEAKTSDSLSYGATAFAAKMLQPGLLLGVGVSAWTGLDDASVFPFVVVNWQINENWHLGNPLASGPAGPAGLELSYKVNPKFELGVGGTWRSFEHRLAQKNAVAAGGRVEQNSVPVFVRAGYQFSREFALDLHVGAAMAGEIIIDNAQGQEISKEKHDAMPFAAISVSGRF